MQLEYIGVDDDVDGRINHFYLGDTIVHRYRRYGFQRSIFGTSRRTVKILCRGQRRAVTYRHVNLKIHPPRDLQQQNRPRTHDDSVAHQPTGNKHAYSNAITHQQIEATVTATVKALQPQQLQQQLIHQSHHAVTATRSPTPNPQRQKVFRCDSNSH